MTAIRPFRHLLVYPAMMRQMREMELQMAKERAELARQRNDLQRLHSEIRHELELAQRDAAVNERLRLLQRRTLTDVPAAGSKRSASEVPTTPSRKIDRNALPRPDSTVDAAADYVAPRNPVEQAVTAVFADTLSVDRVGIHDNLFELGGHSLHATSILSKLAATFGVDVELRQFFQHPTVAATAHALTSEARGRVEQAYTYHPMRGMAPGP